MEKILKIYLRLLEIHIKTKCVDEVFHKASERLYDLAFKCYHTSKERMQDLEIEEPVENLHEVEMESYKLLEEMKDIIGDEIKDNQTFGYDNLLRGLYDEVENECGNIRGFIRDEHKINKAIEEMDKKEDVEKASEDETGVEYETE